MKYIVAIVIVAVITAVAVYHWKRYQKYGTVTIDIFPNPAILGQETSITASFERGIQEGDDVTAVLYCEERTWKIYTDDSDQQDHMQEVKILWKKEQSLPVQLSPQGQQVVFQATIPFDQPQSTGKIAEPLSSFKSVEPEIAWVVKFHPPGESEHSGFEFDITVQK
ncbi:MAG: hypothetical protein HQL70_01190 [Magnetococcales bacterium]|nr:hypothetical protein [Magnetococcales bacterium]